MSDLCYNCSSCHLTVGPCLRDLVQCEICYSWGHLYIFCPRGVTLRDRAYRFWGLCHNCDSWHLPNPCSKDYHQCGQCGHDGHLEFFCPVRPTDRISHLKEQRRLQENGQGPVNHDLRPPYKGALPQETITKIKLDALRQAFNLFDIGLTPQQVIDYMAGPPRVMQPVLVPGGTLPRQLPVVGQATSGAQLLLNDPIQPTAHKTTQTGTNHLEHKFELGMYTRMHRRFDQGDLAKSIEQGRPMDTISMMETPSKAPRMPMSLEAMPAAQVTTPMMQNSTLKTQTTGHGTQDANQKLQDNESEQKVVPTIEEPEKVRKPGKKDKPNKAVKIERQGTPAGSAAKQGRRCVACVKSHKRCTHRVQQSPTPQPGPDGSFVTPIAAVNPVPTSGALESHTKAPQPIPDHSLALPNENAALPTPLTLEKGATAKRKR